MNERNNEFSELIKKVIGDIPADKKPDDFNPDEARQFLESLFGDMMGDGVMTPEQMFGLGACDDCPNDECEKNPAYGVQDEVNVNKINAEKSEVTIRGTFVINAEVDDIEDIHMLINELLADKKVDFRIKEVENISYFN